jgi:hypothetical protein
MTKINKTQAVGIIKNSKNQPFKVTFIKKDKTERTIIGTFNSATNKLGYLNVYDLIKEDFRNVNSQTIKTIVFNKIKYKVK